MRVKIFKAESISNVERDINLFLSERKDIHVISIQELYASTYWAFIILYEVKE
jgi:hypothetical protein